MRPPHPPRIGLNAICRHASAHSCSYSSSMAGLRPLRSFHLTVPASLPRKRYFFTSNPFLHSSSGADEPYNPSGKGAASKHDGGGQYQPSAGSSSSANSSSSSSSKRKPTRAATAKNSLRRVAIIAQQQPKRTTPSGVDATADSDPSNIVSATCLAESFNMAMVLETLSSHGFEIDPDGTGFDAGEVLHARGLNGGDIFVFPSGTVVTWSLPPDIVTRQILRTANAAQDPHRLPQREVEDLEFTTDTARETSVLKGDMIVLGTRREHRDGDTLDTTLAKVAFSSGLARSTKLAVLESALTSYFESTRSIPDLLSQGHGVPLGRRFILQKTGELLSLRARLNHYSELTDSLPDIFWDSRSELGLENYYEQVGRGLDVNVRIKTLNQKMDYAQEIATVLREMSSEQHGTRLELIIILLIAVEVIFELRRIVLEWNHDKEVAAAAEAAATHSSISDQQHRS